MIPDSSYSTISWIVQKLLDKKFDTNTQCKEMCYAMLIKICVYKKSNNIITNCLNHSIFNGLLIMSTVSKSFNRIIRFRDFAKQANNIFENATKRLYTLKINLLNLVCLYMQLNVFTYTLRSLSRVLNDFPTLPPCTK